MEKNIYNNKAMSKAGLTGLSGGATTYSTGSAALIFAIDGKVYSAAQVSGGTTPTVNSGNNKPISVTAGRSVLVVWAIDAANNVKLFQGDEGPAGSMLEFPALPNDVAPFAYSIHKGGSTVVGTWTVGSSNWNATGMTQVVQDICEIPTRPVAG